MAFRFHIFTDKKIGIKGIKTQQREEAKNTLSNNVFQEIGIMK